METTHNKLKTSEEILTHHLKKFIGIYPLKEILLAMEEYYNQRPKDEEQYKKGWQDGYDECKKQVSEWRIKNDQQDYNTGMF